MNIDNEAIQVLTQEIIKTIKTIINKSNFDRTVKGRITAHLGNNKYQVQLNDGQEYQATSLNACNVNEVVYIKIASNNYNNLIIESPMYRTNESSTWTLEDTDLDLDF